MVRPDFLSYNPEIQDGLPAISEQLSANIVALTDLYQRDPFNVAPGYEHEFMRDFIREASAICQDGNRDVIDQTVALLNDLRFSDFFGIKPELGDAFSISPQGIALRLHSDGSDTSRYDLHQNLLPNMAQDIVVTISGAQPEEENFGRSSIVLKGTYLKDEEKPLLNIIPQFAWSRLERGYGIHIVSIGDGDRTQTFSVGAGACSVGSIGERGVVKNVEGRVDIGESRGRIFTYPYTFTTARRCAGSISHTSNARMFVGEMVLRPFQPIHFEQEQIDMDNLRGPGDCRNGVEPVLVIDTLCREDGEATGEGYADIRLPKQSAIMHIRNCKSELRVKDFGTFAEGASDSRSATCTLATNVHGDMSFVQTDGDSHILQRVSADGKTVQRVSLTKEQIADSDREDFEDGSWYLKTGDELHVFGRDDNPTYLGYGSSTKVFREMPEELQRTRLNF